MHRGCHVLVSAGLLAFILAAVPAAPAFAQWTPNRLAADESELSRTPWGAPDLQGVWNNSTTTPLERLTREERAQGRQAQQAIDAAGLVSRQRMQAGHPGVREPAVPFAPIPDSGR